MPDLRFPSAIVAVTVLIALLAAACSSTAVPEANGKSATAGTESGSTSPTATVLGDVLEPARLAVLVPDFENLSTTGLVPTLSVAQYGDFWRAELTAYNAGHPGFPPVDLDVVSWDPLTPESTQQACREVLDLGATVVATTANFPESGYRCFSDAGLVVITVGPVTRLRLTRFGGLVFSVLPSRETLAVQTIEALDRRGLLPTSVALIGNTQEGDRQGADAAVGTLETLGYAVHSEQVQTALGIVEIRRDASGIAQRIGDAGAEAIVFASNATVANELAPHLRQLGVPVFFIDIDGITTLDAARRLGPLWVNTVAATALRPTSSPASEFEAQCQSRFRQFIRGEADARAVGNWDARSSQRPASNRGAPVDQVEPSGDVGYHECTIVGALGAALEVTDGVGSSEAIADALVQIPTIPVALGESGQFKPNQHWLTNEVGLVQLTADERCAYSETCWVELGS